jgi:hypothetical protein
LVWVLLIAENARSAGRNHVFETFRAFEILHFSRSLQLSYWVGFIGLVFWTGFQDFSGWAGFGPVCSVVVVEFSGSGWRRGRAWGGGERTGRPRSISDLPAPFHRGTLRPGKAVFAAGAISAWKLGSLEAWKLGSLEAWKLGS